MAAAGRSGAWRALRMVVGVVLATLLCVQSAISSQADGTGDASRVVFPWMCLERCGDNSSALAAQLRQLTAGATVLTGAAFEDYNLGPNSTLVKNNLTQVAGPLAAHKLPTRWAMVSS